MVATQCRRPIEEIVLLPARWRPGVSPDLRREVVTWTTDEREPNGVERRALVGDGGLGGKQGLRLERSQHDATDGQHLISFLCRAQLRGYEAGIPTVGIHSST